MNYSILMLKKEDAQTHKRFMDYDWTMAHGGVVLSEYETVYTGNVTPRETIGEVLESIYTMFNIRDSVSFPREYTGRSLSVSDVITLDGIGNFFVDRFGFKQLGKVDRDG